MNWGLERTALVVKEKCVGSEGEVRQGSKRIAFSFCRFLAEYHKFIWAPKGPKIYLDMLGILDISLFKCSP